MKKSIKFLAILLTMVLTFGIAQIGFIANAANSNDILYNIIGNEAIVDCQGSWISGDVVIASSYEGKAVTGLVNPDYAGYENVAAYVFSSGVTSITLPNTIKAENLSGYPFYGCPSAKIIISDNNPELCLEGNVLYNKDKTKLIRYQNSTSKSFTIPESVKEVAGYAFNGSNLENLTIPNSKIKFGDSGYYGIYDIKNVYFNGTENEWNDANLGLDFPNATVHFTGNNNSSGDSSSDNSASFDLGEFLKTTYEILTKYVFPVIKLVAEITFDIIVMLIK